MASKGHHATRFLSYYRFRIRRLSKVDVGSTLFEPSEFSRVDSLRHLVGRPIVISPDTSKVVLDALTGGSTECVSELDYSGVLLGVGVGPGQQDHLIRESTERRPDLVPVYEPVITLPEQ